jgi:hypothetical protein
MKEISGSDNLAIAWQYPGQAMKVIPAHYSRMTRPTTWMATCLVDSDCDDGLWCNGTILSFGNFRMPIIIYSIKTWHGY